MTTQILKWLVRGLVLLTTAPFLLVGAVLTILFAMLVGTPLTVPSPPLFRRYRPAPEAAPDPESDLDLDLDLESEPAPQIRRPAVEADEHLLETA